MSKWAILFFLLSFSAPACPDLSGLYTNCQSTDPDSQEDKVLIEQSTDSGITTYKMNNEIFITDGKTYTTSYDGQDELIVKLSSTCSSTELIVNNRMMIDTEVVSEFKLRIKRSGNKLIQTLKGESSMGSLDEIITCSRGPSDKF